MVEFKDFDDSKLYEYTSENLKQFINEIEMKKSVIREQRAHEMAEVLKDVRFDPFSFGGKRKLRKIAEKYDGMFAGANEYMSIISAELSRREMLEENSSYSGKGSRKKNESVEEFLRKEEDKTWAMRSKIE